MNENSHKRHTGHRRMPRIQSLVEANGEYDKIINGLFENYLSIKGTTSFDPDFRKVCFCTWSFSNQFHLHYSCFRLCKCMTGCSSINNYNLLCKRNSNLRFFAIAALHQYLFIYTLLHQVRYIRYLSIQA